MMFPRKINGITRVGPTRREHLFLMYTDMLHLSCTRKNSIIQNPLILEYVQDGEIVWLNRLKPHAWLVCCTHGVGAMESTARSDAWILNDPSKILRSTP